jgi:class 3 adenylate cyclase
MKPLIRLLVLTITFIAFSGYTQSAISLYQEGKELRAEGKKSKSIKKLEEALKKAESDRNINLQMNCHVELAELKDNVINYKEALDHYKAFSKLYKKKMSQKTEELETSVNDLQSEVVEGMEAIEEKNQTINSNQEAIQELTNEQMEADLEISNLELDKQKHEAEIKDSENRRNILFLIIGMFAIVMVFVIVGYVQKRKINRTLRNKNYQIIKEREKSDDLLLNILPKKIADELKEKGKTSIRKYENATVMFTDFKGFTKYAEQNTPEEVIALLDHYFCAFDEIIEKYDIEKIKTIGDAYLCVSGIPESKPGHTSKMIKIAFEMMQVMEDTQTKMKDIGGVFLEMRIGIHCGPLVAGVVGSRKFAYDVWGDTVNIAARMEQSGQPGDINVSEAVYVMAKDDFNFNYRGEVEAKNKGKMKMYFVEDRSI